MDFSMEEDIFYLVWSMKVHYNVHKRPPLDDILNQMNPVHILNLITWNFILILYYHLRHAFRVVSSLQLFE
jgi:hypothetical protein